MFLLIILIPASRSTQGRHAASKARTRWRCAINTAINTARTQGRHGHAASAGRRPQNRIDSKIIMLTYTATERLYIIGSCRYKVLQLNGL